MVFWGATMVDEKEKQNCSGCSACACACPNNCIEMFIDEQGFRYPHIDYVRCVQCGLCDKVCENANLNQNMNISPKGFGAFAKNEELRFKSSSGGIFSLLAEKVLETKGIVVGAAFSEDFKSVQHLFADSKEGIEVFKGSKYLQSDVRDSFKKIKGYLQQGRQVLFSGTPCQVDGLKAFLKTDYDNLLCIDIVCHGVPSPKMWAKYCDEVEKKHNGKIVKVNFRHKKYSWESFGLATTLKGQKGFYLSKDEDPYLRLFLKNYTLRPSCYSCSHKGINRKSDITIADFWGVKKVVPELSDGKGTSLLLVHSKKGLMYVDAIKDLAKIVEVDAKQAVNLNKAALHSVKRPAKVKAFWEDFERLSTNELAQKYDPLDIKKTIRLMIKKTNLYKILRKFRGGPVNMENGLGFIVSKGFQKGGNTL